MLMEQFLAGSGAWDHNGFAMFLLLAAGFAWHTCLSISWYYAMLLALLSDYLLSGPLNFGLHSGGDPSLGYLLARRPVITRIASKACSWSWWLLVMRLYYAAAFEGM
ncbi:hypothetical protein Nepgr_018748 [Nepenthes gracilis]|uniref:Uncharacterized protein n=1 Tax=Nepenthes gracilis TaxID=150966 RepID=A0AAD3SUQ8_NEPGR|nr:hypothetical protein Nepgr_018748 [Nepenthes gracilis]